MGMKRYLLSFLAAYLASVGAFVVMLLISLSNWFMTDSPLWFDVLCVIVVVLPMLALGEVFGRRPKAKLVQKPGLGLIILLAIMTILAFLSAAGDTFQMLSWPGLLMGNAIGTLLGGSGYWDGAFILLGNLLLPMLFHIGWRWGSHA
jgi:uncharacterized membrane protein